jgi:hypothetical protein
MKQQINRIAALSGLVFALVLGLAVQPALAVPVDQDFGSPSEEGNAERVIKIAPDAKWVNVTEGETVKFIDEASGKSFAWRFDTIVAVFDLGRVAPAGVLAGHHVDAYVAVSYRRMNNG